MSEPPAARIERLFDAGGAACIGLLQHCVRSVTLAPLFVFLGREYRLRPTHIGALTLFDVFCAADAPARIKSPLLSPPNDLALAGAIATLRRQWLQLQQPEPPAEGMGVPITTPLRGLFDRLSDALIAQPHGDIARLAIYYDERLSPSENLAGGRMTSVQRHFVEYVWKPIARPRLVAGGFWRVQTIE